MLARGWKLAVVGALALAGCELQEVTTARPQPFVVAEVVLRAAADTQYAYLHSGLAGSAVAVPDARVLVLDEQTGDTIRFRGTDAWRCLSPLPADPATIGSCYLAVAPGRVRAGGSYHLHVALPDGGELTGRTRVPGPVALLQPLARHCALPPDTTLAVTWRQVADAWVYLVEAQLLDIFPALVARGVIPDTQNVPLRLEGLAIGASDTTLVIPSELGLFDRFDAELHAVLLALQGGFPPGVSGDVAVAAADRNYVNWVRGGAFNPSGQVRIGSVRGAGTGVFGSMSLARFSFRVTRESGLPSCR